MTEPPVLASTQRTYALMVAVMAGLLGAALIIPVALGHTPQPPATGLATLPLQVTDTPGPTAGASSDQPGATPTTVDGIPSDIAAPGLSSSATPSSAPRATGPDAGLFAGAGGSSSSVVHTASDVGVTPGSITVGVLLVDLGGVSKTSQQAATETGYSPTEQEGYFDTYFKAVNDAGGVQGRTIIPSYQTVDVLSQDSSTAACKTFTEGADKIFVATNVLGVYGPPILCYTQQHATPYIGNDGAVSQYYPDSKGLLFTIQPSTLRTQLNDVYEMYQAGELTKPGEKIGFVHEDDYLDADSASVEAYITQLTGQTPVDGTSSSSDTSMAQSELANDAVKMCTQGVNAIFVGINALYMEEFGEGVDAQPNCAPSYYTSDFDYQMAGDAFLGGQSTSYYDNAYGVSSSLVGDPRIMKPVRPVEAQCLQTYVAGGGTAYAPTDAHYIRAMAVCGLVSSIVARAGRSRPEPDAAGVRGRGCRTSAPSTTPATAPRRSRQRSKMRRTRSACSRPPSRARCWVPVGSGDFHPSRY